MHGNMGVRENKLGNDSAVENDRSWKGSINCGTDKGDKRTLGWD